jgi:hypothetical protein
MKIKSMIAGIALLFALGANTVFAQTETEIRGNIQCGDVVEGEVISGRSQTASNPYGGSTDITFDAYNLQVQAGTRINLTVQPLGNTFNAAFVLRDSGENDVLLVNDNADGQVEQLIDFQLGSSNQVLRIMGVIPGDVGTDYFYRSYNGGPYNAGQYFGAYQISLGCTLRDGTVIEPGDPLTQGGSTQPIAVAPPAFGFPGLQSVDFASAFRLPLTIGTPTQGEIPSSEDAVLGFRFNGSAGDSLDLNFERTSGNLNLGIVVLSADNQVAYMAALVTSESMNSRFTLPSTSEYTIGVFRISLIPPDSPEATGFTITATLDS